MWSRIEGDVEGFFKSLWTIIVNFFQADVEPMVNALLPIVESAATTYLTGNPGAGFNDFLHNVFNAVKPQLSGDLTQLEDSAITFVISGVAGKLGVPNVTGNQGLLPGGNQTTS